MDAGRHGIAGFSTLILAALLAGPAGAQGGGLAEFLDRIEVRVANVEVIVTDRAGNPWPGLEREDFELFEDGVPVEITNFAAYDERFDEIAGAAPTKPDPGAGLLPGEAPPAPATSWIVFVDQSRLEAGPRNQVLAATREFLERARRPDERILVATWDGQRMRVVSQLSDDSRAAASALADLAREPTPYGAARQRAAELQREVVTVGSAAVGGGPRSGVSENLLTEAMARAIREEITLESDEEERRTRRAIRALQDLTGLVEGVGGRRVLLMAGAGFDLDPGEALVDLWTSRFGGTERASRVGEAAPREAALNLEYARALDALLRSGLTVHTVFAGTGRGTEISAEGASSSIELGALGTAAGAAGAAGTLATLAAQTGGRSFQAGPGLADRLAEIRRDLGTYYSLGYRPAASGDATLHRLEVRVRREGARVRHRAARAERTPSAAAAAAALAVLVRPETRPAAGWSIETGAPRPGARGGARTLPVTVRLPLAQVALLPAGAVHQARLHFHFAAATLEGGFVRFEPSLFAFELANDDLESALARSVTYRVELPLAPGSYRLSVAVLDELAETHFTIVAPAEMPAER